MNLHEIVNISLALAVAAIPEGLLIAVTTILAIGMHRMLKRKALVRHLVAAETLGSVSVICTDKTGTLTEGRMQVVRVISENFDVKIEHQKAKTILQNPEVKNIVFSCVLNNDAQAPKLIGHSTEIALLELARLIHVDVQAIKKSFPRITEIPFSSDLKYMATVHSCKEEELLVVKGAPEKIFSMSNNDVKSIDRFRRLTEEMAEGGLRPLCVAQKRNKKIDLSQKISDLTCIGLVGIKDPLRPQAIEAIKEIHNAGIRVVIVTGDHKKTATNIAQQVGISSSSHKILTGQELDKMSSQELAAQIQDVDVFARIDPHHKINIVRAWQQHGHSVAMTGDGVNDAPALKAADIGIALGSGSDVAHETSDMVLLDNNLSTIGAAVHEGRIVFDNIRKVIVYLMSDSFSEIVLIGMSLILGLPSPFLAVQIFWINLITDGFPDLALTVEPGEHGIMQEKPRQKTEPVVNSEMKTIIFGIGIITDIGLFAMYILLLFYSSLDLKHIRTIMFTGLAIDSLLYVFSVRSMRFSLFKINPFSNHWLLVAVVAGFFVQLSAIYFPPLQKLLSTISLGFFEWSIILGLALVKIIAIEATKEFFILRRKKKS